MHFMLHMATCMLQKACGCTMSRFFVSRRKHCKDFSANTAQEEGDRRNGRKVVPFWSYLLAILGVANLRM